MIKFVKEVTDVELESLRINDGQDLEKLPPDKRDIFCKRTFNIEKDGQCKMHPVGYGFMQKRTS